MNVTLDALKEHHKDEKKAKDAFAEIARLGGFGDATAPGGLEGLDGGLDLTGVFDKDNDAIKAEDKAAIKKLLPSEVKEAAVEAKKEGAK